MATGRKRKERRRARQAEAAKIATSHQLADEVDIPNHTPARVGGRAESGLTHAEEFGLIARSVAWNRDRRYPTRMTRDELIAVRKSRGAETVIETALLSAADLMASSCERAKGIGTRLIVAMESANQRDEHEHRRQGDEVREINITTNNVLTVGQIKVVEHVDWYGSRAAAASAESTESDAASDTSADGE